MPVTIRTAPHSAREHAAPSGSVASFRTRYENVIQSSFDKLDADIPLQSSDNGFVRAAIEAYSGHHNLILRPEDIWFAILNQLGFFVNGHSEEVRDFFVAHEGQKHLEIYAVGMLETVDIGSLAVQMTDLIAKNVKDPELRTWVMPDFTTTTQSDKVVAAILMMGALQKYFSYGMTLTCGIPSVTLLGTREDWNEMVNRLEMLSRLGDEPQKFYCLLKPVLERFVATFDSPDDPAVVDFWQRIAHYNAMGSGTDYYTGWITAFCLWDENGKAKYTTEEIQNLISGEFNVAWYPVMEIDDVPQGFGSVPVRVNDNGAIHQTNMVAGSIGYQVTSSGDGLDRAPSPVPTGFRRPQSAAEDKLRPTPTEHIGAAGLDTLQPICGWWMYEESKSRNTTVKFMDNYLCGIGHWFASPVPSEGNQCRS